MNDTIRIKQVVVSKLFGIYDYQLVQKTDSDIMILYGDNGSGKTTILSCLYHLLNPEETKGHRTAIGDIPFLSFSVILNDDTTVSAFRDDIKNKEYSIEFTYQSENYVYHWEQGSPRTSSDEDRRVYYLYCSYLSSLKINAIFLSANRKIYEDKRDGHVAKYQYSYVSSEDERSPVFEDELSLEQVVDQFHRWMHSRIISLTNEGNKSIGDHYLSIIKKIKNNKSERSVEVIKTRIRSLIDRNMEYTKFGLSTDLFSNQFKETINSLSDEEWVSVEPVLDSYLSSLELRLNALSSIQFLFQKLERVFASLFKDKTIKVSTINGIEVFTRLGEKLELNRLSSGEKQFLYMICRIVAATSSSSVIIIDEPEISFNIKWQRDFLRIISSIIGKGKMQVIIATHSIEMITPYLNSVVQLK